MNLFLQGEINLFSCSVVAAPQDPKKGTDPTRNVPLLHPGRRQRNPNLWNELFPPFSPVAPTPLASRGSSLGFEIREFAAFCAPLPKAAGIGGGSVGGWDSKASLPGAGHSCPPLSRGKSSCQLSPAALWHFALFGEVFFWNFSPRFPWDSTARHSYR